MCISLFFSLFYQSIPVSFFLFPPSFSLFSLLSLPPPLLPPLSSPFLSSLSTFLPLSPFLCLSIYQSVDFSVCACACVCVIKRVRACLCVSLLQSAVCCQVTMETKQFSPCLGWSSSCRVGAFHCVYGVYVHKCVCVCVCFLTLYGAESQ